MASLMDILAGAGNLLDLPGSSLRDLLSGRNPFDQWATPFSDVNRASGRDVLQPFLGANEETGMSGWMDNPMEGFKDIAGFGAEMLLDPLNLVPLGAVGKALKGRKAARSANAAMKAERGGKYALVNPKVAGRANPFVDTQYELIQAVENNGVVPGYHASKNRISEFSDEYLGSNSAKATGIYSADAKLGHQFVPDPEMLRQYPNRSKLLGDNIHVADVDMGRTAVINIHKLKNGFSTPESVAKLKQYLTDSGFNSVRLVGGGEGRLTQNTIVPLTSSQIKVQGIENPMRLLGYTPPNMSIADRLQEAASLRKQRDEFMDSANFPDNTPWEEMKPFYDKAEEMDVVLRQADPTLDDRVARFHSKPIVGVSRDEWLTEVGEKNQALKKLLRGLDMSQPDDQMVLKNLGSAFDGSADPFAESGPLMNTMRQFASDVADADIAIIEPIYEAVYNPKFLDLAKRTAESAGVKVDDRFDQWLPELFHEGPTSRQARMFKGMREGIPRILDETPADDPTRAMMEQILNVSNIYKDPMDAAKFEYDRQLAKFSTNIPNPVQKNPMLPMQQVQQPVARVADSPLMSTMNPMQLQPETSPFPAAVAGAVYNALQAFNERGGIQ